MNKKSLMTTALTFGALGALVGAALLATAPASAAPAAAVDAPVFGGPPAGTTNFTGKWAMTPRPTALKTLDGKEPPLNAAGKAELARRQAALKAGDKKIDPISDCIMHGMPRLLYAPYPFLILQTKDGVNFVHQVNHTFRAIYFEPLPEEPDPNYLGYAAAKWEGKTLVIDSIGFNDKTWLDYSGLPHGTKLKVQERYTLASPTTIKGEVTITDPDFYTAPWKTGFTLTKQPGSTLAENVCTDTHKM